MSQPPPLRSACPVAASLDLVVDRWTLVILGDLRFAGRSQFAELAAEGGIATNALSQRLHRLLDAGLVIRRRDPTDGRPGIYLPTAPAVALIVALVHMMLWGPRHTAGSAPSWGLEASAIDKAGVTAERMARAFHRVSAD